MKLKNLLVGRKDKKGVLGLDTAKQFILAILIIAVIAFATIIALATLNDSNVLTPGSLEANQSTNVLQNVSTGVSEFFNNATTWFALLAVVIIILIIAVVILAVNQFSTGTRESGSGRQAQL